MARRAIPIIAFPRVRCMFIYIYIYSCVTYASIVYVVKEVTSSRGLGQLMGVARNRTLAQVLQTSTEQQKENCSFTSLCRNWN